MDRFLLCMSFLCLGLESRVLKWHHNGEGTRALDGSQEVVLIPMLMLLSKATPSPSLGLCFLLHEMGVLLTVRAASGMGDGPNTSPKALGTHQAPAGPLPGQCLSCYLPLYSIHLDPLAQ